MNTRYIYQGAPEERAFGPLPAGDYTFKIVSADPPYFKNEHWVMPLKVAIEPSGLYVFANPWSGTDRNGEIRDGIAELLVAVNRVPAKGQEPEWDKLVGARGKCRLKVEVAQVGALAGKEVNKVAFFHRPKQLVEQQLPKVGPKPPVNEPADDLNMEPTDIPF